MRRVPRLLLCAPAAVAAIIILTACGGATSSPVTGVATPVARQLTPAQAHPAAAVAPATLSRIADVAPARSRIGYVNLAALAGLDAPLPAREIARLVVGDAAPDVGTGRGTATRIGPATVIDGHGPRVVEGGDAGLRRALAITAPATSLITRETQSAAQSCVGDPAAETMIGPAVLGTKSAIAVGLQDDASAPAGSKLLVCAAPHYVRDLRRIERRLRARFADDALPPDRRPVIGLADIGERDVVRAIVALDTVDGAVLRGLLAGGPALSALAGR